MFPIRPHLFFLADLEFFCPRMVFLRPLQSEYDFIIAVTCSSYNCPAPSSLLKTSPSPASIACPTGTCTDNLCCDSAFFAVISSFIFFSMPPFCVSLMCVSCSFLLHCFRGTSFSGSAARGGPAKWHPAYLYTLPYILAFTGCASFAKVPPPIF